MKIYFTLYLIPVVIAALLVFWLALRNERVKLLFVIVLSVAVLAVLHPFFAAIAVGLVVVTHQLVDLKRRKKLSGGRAVLIILAIAVITLGIGKYGQRGAVAIWGQDDWIVGHLLMPLGISYFVFRLLQYVFDCLRGVIEENSLLRLAAFVLFIPTFPAGPLETYQGFYEKRSYSFDRQLFYLGLRRIALGYFKKVFVVDFVFALFFAKIITSVGNPDFHASQLGPWWPLAYCIVVFVRAYFDLSAYTDLAIGFSALFGFRIMENFHLPFLQKNLSDFWRSWHISLSTWCRNNVYFPVFGLTRKVWVGLYASMLTMGLWHYVDLNWTAWGLYHATGLVVVARWERWKRKRKKARKKAGSPPAAPYEKYVRWLGYPATFLYVALGYAFVSTHTLGHALTIIYLAFRLPLAWLTGHVL
ncbi:MAG TPA: MBOAT family O-acyltransferase [Thermoleophilia bacterium]